MLHSSSLLDGNTAESLWYFAFVKWQALECPRFLSLVGVDRLSFIIRSITVSYPVAHFEPYFVHPIPTGIFSGQFGPFLDRILYKCGPPLYWDIGGFDSCQNGTCSPEQTWPTAPTAADLHSSTIIPGNISDYVWYVYRVVQTTSYLSIYLVPGMLYTIEQRADRNDRSSRGFVYTLIFAWNEIDTAVWLLAASSRFQHDQRRYDDTTPKCDGRFVLHIKTQTVITFTNRVLISTRSTMI